MNGVKLLCAGCLALLATSAAAQLRQRAVPPGVRVHRRPPRGVIPPRPSPSGSARQSSSDGAAPRPPYQPQTPGAAAADRMLARLKEVRTLRARLSGKIVYEGHEVETTTRLSFARPDRIRLDLKAMDQQATAVLVGQKATVWLPGQRMVLRQEIPQLGEGRWDAFANPLDSLLALLSPGAEDRAALEKTFLPRVKLLPPERLEGELFERLRARGAFGAVVDLWLNPGDHLLRRVRLSQPDVQPGLEVEYLIEVEAIDLALPKDQFQLTIPKNAVDPMKEAEREARGAVGVPEADSQVKLRRLEARAAKAPRDAGLQLQLATAYQELGQATRGIGALRKALALDPSLANYERAWQLAAEMSQWKAAAAFLIAGAEKYGEKLLDVSSEEGYGLVQIAQAAGMAAEVACGVEKALPAAKNPWRLRSLLVGLYNAAGKPDAATTHWLALVDPGEGPGAFSPERQVAVEAALAEFSTGGLRWPEAQKAPVLAALRRCERRLSPDSLPGLASLYLAADAPGDAARLVDLVGPDDLDGIALRDIAAALKRKGETRRAEQLFRMALLRAAGDDPVDYSSVSVLLSTPEAKELLAPVLRQLAQAERPRDPLVAAHWLYLAGDFQPAAAAYEAYLASPAAAPDAVPATERYLAAALGVISARQAGDDGLLHRLTRLAVEEIPFAEMEMGGQQTLAEPLLDAVSATPALATVFGALAEASPQTAWNWLSQQGSAPETLDGPTLRKALERIVPTLRHQEQSLLEAASTLATLGRPEEAAAPLLLALKEKPDEVDVNQVVGVAARLKDPEPVLALVRERLKKNDTWTEGIRILAETRWARGDADGAARELAAAAARTKSTGLYRRLADLQWQSGRRPDAIASLRQALKMAKDDVGLAAGLAKWLLRAGQLPEALALYRKLASGTDLGAAAEVADGLLGAGQPAEALRYLEHALKAAAKGDPDQGEQLRAQLAGFYLAGSQPQKVLSLYRALVTELRATEFDPEYQARRGPGRMPGDRARNPLPLVARALERTLPAAATPGYARQAEVARRAYAGAIFQQVAQAEDFEAYAALCARAGAFDEARGVLSRWVDQDPIGGGRLREVCLALLDEAQGKKEAAAVFRRAAQPYGAPAPHASTAAQIACDRLALLAEKEGRGPEAERYRRWARAMHLLAEGKTEEAATAAPELPCPLLHQLVGEESEEDENSHPLLDPNPELLRRALDRLLPLADGARSCPYCQPALLALDPGSPTCREWLASHRQEARAHLIAAVALEPGDERHTLNRRAEAYLRQAVTLDPQLAAAWEGLRDYYQMLPGETPRLLEAAEKVAAARPDDLDALAGLARAYAQAGRRIDAEAAWQKVRQIDPQAYVALDDEERYSDAERQESDPLLQLLATQQQRNSMVVRWLITELPGLPLGGWLGGMGQLMLFER